MSTQSNGRNRQAAVEIKGSAVTLPIVRLLNADMAAITEQLHQRIEQAPDFFRGAPVVIDVSALANESEEATDLSTLIESLQGMGMIPVGLRGGGEAIRQAAAASNLACLADAPPAEIRGRPAETSSQTSEPVPPTASSPAHALLITQPVRSGQRVYAKGTDLIVMAPVGYGAEIMADGHIHVYGTLRGRALAGVRGDSECRIFCQDLQAELISIAGHYRVSEDLEEAVRGKAVQVYMDDTALIIEAL